MPADDMLQSPCKLGSSYGKATAVILREWHNTVKLAMNKFEKSRSLKFSILLSLERHIYKLMKLSYELLLPHNIITFTMACQNQDY